MNTSTKFADVCVLMLAVVLGAGSIAMFAALQAVRFAPMGWPDGQALAWDALLSLAFFAQHSGMVRRPVRAWIARFIPARYEGAVYAIASGIVLALVVIFWQRSETTVYQLGGGWRRIAQALGAVAAAAFVLSALTLRRSFDPLGLGPIRAHLRGRPYRPGDFVLRGPYRWVRHPLYSCILAMFWTNPDVTGDQLLLNVLWTIWIVVGAVLDERDLVAEFGDAYRDYQRQVPMLIPWRLGSVRPAGV